MWAVSSSGGKYVLTCTLPPGDYAGWVVDPTLTLQPDATDGKDTIISGSAVNQTKNYGVNAVISIGDAAGGVGAERLLVAFTLTDLPSIAVLSSTTMSLTVLQDNSNNARTFRVYRQKRAWLEGTRVNTLDDPPTGATWGRYDTTNNWATAGGFGAADCEQADIGTCAFGAAEAVGAVKVFTLTPTSKAGLDLGSGWLVKADTEFNDGYYFDSSDSTTAANRPKLTIDYTLPTQSSQVGRIARLVPAGVTRKSSIVSLVGLS